MNRPLVTPLLLMLACSPSMAAPGDMDCLIQPHQVIQVGSPVPGVIGAVGVERGDEIRQGQVIASLQAEVEQAALRLARARARSEAELVAAAQSGSFARRELARANQLADEKFVSRTFVDKASTEASIAQSKMQQAQERRRLAQIELEVATAQLAQRTIKSPIDGIVIDRFLSVGEYVDDRPVARIAQIDPLRVEVVVPASQFGRIHTGQMGTVTPDDGSGNTLQASVSVVDRIVDAASGTFRVRLELPNPQGRIAPGLRCQVRLADDVVAEPATPATPAAAPAVPARG